MLSSDTVRMSEAYKMCSVMQSDMPAAPDALEDPVRLPEVEQGYP